MTAVLRSIVSPGEARMINFNQTTNFNETPTQIERNLELMNYPTLNPTSLTNLTRIPDFNFLSSSSYQNNNINNNNNNINAFEILQTILGGVALGVGKKYNKKINEKIKKKEKENILIKIKNLNNQIDENYYNKLRKRLITPQIREKYELEKKIIKQTFNCLKKKNKQECSIMLERLSIFN